MFEIDKKDIIMSIGYDQSLSGLAYSYNAAANELNTYENYRKNGEKFCFPILYMYRHSFELKLKGLLCDWHALWCYKNDCYKNKEDFDKQIMTLLTGKSSDICLMNWENIYSIIENNKTKEINDLNDLIKNGITSNTSKEILKVLNMSLIGNNSKYLQFMINLIGFINVPINSHNLKRYLDLLEIYLINENSKSLNQFTSMKQKLLRLNQIDSDSISFRYPFKKNGTNTDFHKLKNKKKESFKNFNFNDLKNSFNEIYWVLDNLEDEPNSFYETIGMISDILGGHYFEDFYLAKSVISKYKMRKALNHINETLDNKIKCYLKPEMVEIVECYKKDIEEINSLFEEKNNNSDFIDSKDLCLLQSLSFATDVEITGNKISAIKKRLILSKKRLEKVYFKIF